MVFLAGCRFFWTVYGKKKLNRPMSSLLYLKLFSRGCFSSSITTVFTPLTEKKCKVSLQLDLRNPCSLCVKWCLYSLPDVHLTRTLSRKLPSLIILDESVKCCCSTLLEMYWFDNVPVGYSLNPRLLSQNNLGF